MAEQKIRSISARELHEQMNQQPSPLVIDVRSQEKYTEGHIPAARNMQKETMLEELTEPAINRDIVVYCEMKTPGHSGSEAAAAQLSEAGYNVQYLDGGFPAWQAAGYTVENGYSDSAKFIGSDIR